MKTKIQVTQEDIDSGFKCDSHLCPLGRALNRTFNVDFIRVGPSYFTFNYKTLALDGKETNLSRFDICIKLGFKAACFVAAFDRGEKVEPFEFEVDLDQYLPVDYNKVRERAHQIFSRSNYTQTNELDNYYQALKELRYEALQELATNLLMKDSKEEVVTISESADLETIGGTSVAEDLNWHSDIEELMPELKTKKFNSINSKISWMFNNLKSVKTSNEVYTN